MNPNDLHKLIKDLQQIMKKDGRITTEENTILNRVMKDVTTFTEAYNKAKEDNVITEDEHVNLAVLWDKIYDDSYAVAMEDNKLSDDEAEMIFKIFDAIKQYY